jgi:hypothetical protein
MSVGDAIMVLGRSQCREGAAENNCSGKRKCCLAKHFFISRLTFAVALSYERLAMVFIPGPTSREELRPTWRSCRYAVMQQLRTPSMRVVGVSFL